MGMKTVAFTALALALSPLGMSGEEDTPPPAEKPGEDESPEKVIRQRFLVAYQTAQTPERKAEAVEMLRGLKEIESQRLIAGMLANASEIVRCKACAVMAGTPDGQGYFVKPLMGMLNDPVPAVRMAAAEALGAATVRGDAIKALAYALMSMVGSRSADSIVTETKIIDAYDKALQKLTGKASSDRGARGISNFWMDYWKKNGEEIVAAEAKARETEPPPRAAGLPRDSFDK